MTTIRALDPERLNATLYSIGYKELSSSTYVHASSSDEVEHLLFFYLVGQQGDCLTADFGVRNREVERFGRDMLLMHGGKLFKSLPNTINNVTCFMRFSLWRLHSINEKSFWLLNDVDLYGQIANRIYPALTSFVSLVGSKNKLFELLSGDSEPCPWFVVNGAARGAQVAFLGAALTTGKDAVRRILIEQKKIIGSNLSREVNVDQYIELVVKMAYSQ